jgi:hypothetical protein
MVIKRLIEKIIHKFKGLIIMIDFWRINNEKIKKEKFSRTWEKVIIYYVGERNIMKVKIIVLVTVYL